MRFYKVVYALILMYVGNISCTVNYICILLHCLLFALVVRNINCKYKLKGLPL